jgi:hypothetical protein
MKNTMAFMLGSILEVLNFKKWNYLNTDNYEKAFYVMGATIGYQKKLATNSARAFFGGTSRILQRLPT